MTSGRVRHEHVDAALELGAAVVVGGRLAQMEVGADGAVEDDDALVHHVQKGHASQATGGVSALSGCSGRRLRLRRR